MLLQQDRYKCTGYIVYTDLYRFGEGLWLNGCFIVYSIELKSKPISHEYQTEQICQPESVTLIRENTNEPFPSKVGRRCVCFSSKFIPCFNTNQVLRVSWGLERSVCDSKCFYSENAFELCKGDIKECADFFAERDRWPTEMLLEREVPEEDIMRYYSDPPSGMKVTPPVARIAAGRQFSVNRPLPNYSSFRAASPKVIQ